MACEKKIKSVSFASHRTVRLIASMNAREDNASCWYSRKELEKIKRNAKVHVKRLQKMDYQKSNDASMLSFREYLHVGNSTIAPRSSCGVHFESLSQEQRETVRGLEHILDIGRLQIKYCVRLAILESQRRLKVLSHQKKNVDPVVQLAMIAGKYSRWARELALATGKMDASVAYPRSTANDINTEVVERPSKRRRVRQDGSSLLLQ